MFLSFETFRNSIHMTQVGAAHGFTYRIPPAQPYSGQPAASLDKPSHPSPREVRASLQAVSGCGTVRKMRRFSCVRGVGAALALALVTPSVASAQAPTDEPSETPNPDDVPSRPGSEAPSGSAPDQAQPGGESSQPPNPEVSDPEAPDSQPPDQAAPEPPPAVAPAPPPGEAEPAGVAPPPPVNPVPAESVTAPSPAASTAEGSVAPTPLAPGTAETTEASPTPSWSWAAPSSSEPTVDQVNESGNAEKVKARVRWRGTAFVWSHDVTTSAVGVGSDYQSTSHQSYTQGYSLTLNYYVVDEAELRWRVAVTPGLDVELTDSGTTTTKSEPVVRDLPLTTVAIVPLYREEGSLFGTSALGNFTAIIPTSKYTRGQGDIVTLSPRLMLLQSLPLAGKGASFLDSILVGAGARYDAQFTEANVGVSDDVADIPRQSTTRRDPQRSASSTDVLSGARVAPHTFRFSGFAMIGDEVLSIPFNFAVGANYTTAQLADDGDTTIELSTGDFEVGASGRRRRPSAGWSAGLTLFPITELGVSMGYSNNADLDSETPNFFYTPSATFSAALAVSIDAIYEGLTGPRREVPFILF